MDYACTLAKRQHYFCTSANILCKTHLRSHPNRLRTCRQASYVDGMSEREKLLKDIETFIAEHDMPETVFGEVDERYSAAD